MTSAPIIPPSDEEQGRIIQDVRDYALNYSENLPDFICAEEVKRYEAPPARQGEGPGWRLGGRGVPVTGWDATAAWAGSPWWLPR